MVRIAKYLILTVMLLASFQVQASVTSVSTTPASRNVPLGRSAAVSLVWVVSDTSGAGSVTVSSSSGQFRTTEGGGTLLGTINTTVSRTYVATGAATTLRISETVLIPTEVIYRAHKLGVSSFVYQRAFTPTTGTGLGSITLNITGASGSSFSVSRLALYFDDGSQVRVLPLKEPLHVQADVGFVGTGLLQGIWEVAGPASTAGNPVYRPLQTVHQYFVSGDKQILRGPALPTDSTGIYLVRFRITEPQPGFDIPVIRYFVSSGKPGATGLPPLTLALNSPSHYALLAPDTKFSWRAIKHARAYQLEMYAKSPESDLPELGGDADTLATIAAALSRPPVTGMILPGGQTDTALPTTARRHLRPNGAYLWRVLAIDEDGAIVAVSQVREIRAP